ncbi:N-6 DNA methylase [Pseudolysinimonas sp.]|uniref:N-6 DNA methylase n=1 Tax=Pseudolysinimonas sp. TaxID=2680009 RepID=UPI003782EB5D
MTRRILYARVEQVREGIERLGIDALWQSLVAVHALRVGGPATAAILADLPRRDPTWQLDLLDGLQMDERSVLYEYSLAYVDRVDRKASGQFFTPDDVARFLADRATTFPDGTWIDPCCGVGNLSFWLAAAQPDPAAFVAERLVLVDRDPRALLIARALLATEFAVDAAGYAALADRSRVADALSDELPAFDFALLNPPYVVVPRDDRFETAEARDLYAYFIERMLTLGRGVVAISPQSFTAGRKFADFRRLLVRRLEVMDVYCFDNVPDNVFRGVKFGSQNTNRVNSTRAAVLVGLAGDPVAVRRHRITPLLRWRAHERDDLFAAADDFLAELQPDELRAFPKVGAALVPLHRAMLLAQTTIGDLTVIGPTAYPLDVPVTPRYFLSAVRRVLDRGHVHRLFFATAEDRDRAAVVLNSSLAYWWWRVYEGGITVAKATLASVPVPLESAPASLVRALEASERDNVVVKQNAGRRNENVKHPWRLLRDLNRAVAPDFVDALLATHANSHLASRGSSARAAGVSRPTPEKRARASG